MKNGVYLYLLKYSKSQITVLVSIFKLFSMMEIVLMHILIFAAEVCQEICFHFWHNHWIVLTLHSCYLYYFHRHTLLSWLNTFVKFNSYTYNSFWHIVGFFNLIYTAFYASCMDTPSLALTSIIYQVVTWHDPAFALVWFSTSKFFSNFPFLCLKMKNKCI